MLAFTSADKIDGGADFDTVTIEAPSGDFSLDFNSTTMLNVEFLVFNGSTFDTTLTPDDATVASGSFLDVDGTSLTGKLIFDGSAETDGSFIIRGGFGQDNLIGGGGNDLFNGGALGEADTIDGGAGFDIVDYGERTGGVTVILNGSIEAVVSVGGTPEDHIKNIESIIGASGNDDIAGDSALNNFFLNAGGDDSVDAGAGNDSFLMSGAFTANDQLDGGNDSDTLSLDGDYSAGVIFGAATLLNVETIVVAAGNDYSLTTHDATVANGATLLVDASGLAADNHLTFDGSAETNGHFTIQSGNGSDTLTGGQSSDTFSFGDITLSGATRDTINGFDFGSDRIAFHTVTGIDANVTTGTLTFADFDTDLATALAGLQSGHAVLFTPDAGDDFGGDKFLVVDNGTSGTGYQAGSDLVVQLHNGQNLGSIDTTDFLVSV